MERIYEKYKGKKINNGVVCGYNETHILLAVEDNPTASFKRLYKGTFVEDKYKDKAFRYIYCDERTIEKQCTPTKK